MQLRGLLQLGLQREKSSAEGHSRESADFACQLMSASHRKAIATIRSASALISTEPATWSNGSLTGSSNVAGSQLATPNWPPTILPSSNPHRSGYGCAI